MSTRPSPPLRPLIVGLGRSGLHTHLPVLTRLRDSGDETVTALFGSDPPLGYDRKGAEVDLMGVPDGELEVAETVARVTELVYPGNTVVHVCTPPQARAAVLRELAERGFRLMLVDSPLATDSESLREVLALATQYRLRIGVVAPWLSSGITRRLLAAVGDGRFGAVRRIAVRQRVPRLSRTFAAESQDATVLDIEMPQCVALALAVAGNAEVSSASMDNTPMIDGRWVQDMGTASLTLRHHGGAVTEITADLAAPVWEQRVVVEFDQGSVECHFPLGPNPMGLGDDHAHLCWMPEHGAARREIFADDALRHAFHHTYRTFVAESWPEPSLRLHARVVEVIAAGKALCSRPTASVPAAAPAPFMASQMPESAPMPQLRQASPPALEPDIPLPRRESDIPLPQIPIPSPVQMEPVAARVPTPSVPAAVLPNSWDEPKPAQSWDTGRHAAYDPEDGPPPTTPVRQRGGANGNGEEQPWIPRSRVLRQA